MPIFTKPDKVQVVLPVRKRWMSELYEVSSSIGWADVLVFSLILGFGILQFLTVQRSADFLSDDVFFADAARSIAAHGFYGINGYAETNMPPGLSGILAAFFIVGGGGHVVFLQLMTVFGTLGFLVSYQLLRKQLPRFVAASSCLLLISSPINFDLATRWVFPCYPYIFTTLSVLLVARKFEEAANLRGRLWWGVLLTALLVVSLLFASAAMAFLGAIVASTVVLFLRNRSLAFARLRMYLPILVLGMAMQALWMHPRIEASAGISAQEWPVAGFPQSYLAQLKVKNGNYPELGMATLKDIPVRILKNAYEQSNLLSRLLLHRPIYVAWMSIMTIGILMLIVLGWTHSIWRTGGGLQEWYFAGYEFIYLLWPWNLESRFFLPVAPLACLYAWRGGKALVLLAKEKPRLLGAVWFPIAILLTVSAWFWVRGSGIGEHLPNAGLQDETSFVVWILSAILAAWMVTSGTSWFTSIAAFFRRHPVPNQFLRIGPARSLQVLGLIVLVSLTVAGLSMELKIARANLNLNSAANRLTPDAEAGEWLASHTDPNAIVMARHVPTVYHYSKRTAVWFPPSSDPQLLIDGILRHKVDFLVTVRRDYSYYLPSDEDCFSPLIAAYPNSFRLLYQAPKFRIFKVIRNSAPHLG